MSDTQSLCVLTFDPDASPPVDPGCLSFEDHECAGYVCDYPLCRAEREQRASRGVKAPPRQPWQSAA